MVTGQVFLYSVGRTSIVLVSCVSPALFEPKKALDVEWVRHSDFIYFAFFHIMGGSSSITIRGNRCTALVSLGDSRTYQLSYDFQLLTPRLTNEVVVRNH
jgi:hypothetical protein